METTLQKRYSILTLFGCLLFLLSPRHALAQTNAVPSCGYNGDGEIGDNTTINRSLITPAYFIDAIKAIASGQSHTLALDSNGTVWTWGKNTYGQLGTGDTANRTTPVPILVGV